MKITNKSIKRICLIFLVALFCLITKSSAYNNAELASSAVNATKGYADWFFTTDPAGLVGQWVTEASETFRNVGEYCAGDGRTRW